jgi:hypothetical protein
MYRLGVWVDGGSERIEEAPEAGPGRGRQSWSGGFEWFVRMNCGDEPGIGECETFHKDWGR